MPTRAARLARHGVRLPVGFAREWRAVNYAADMTSSLGPSSESGLMPGANEELLFAGRPALIQGVGGLVLAIVTLGLSLIVTWFRSRAVHYKITSQRIV